MFARCEQQFFNAHVLVLAVVLVHLFVFLAHTCTHVEELKVDLESSVCWNSHKYFKNETFYEIDVVFSFLSIKFHNSI